MASQDAKRESSLSSVRWTFRSNKKSLVLPGTLIVGCILYLKFFTVYLDVLWLGLYYLELFCGGSVRFRGY